MDKTCVCAKKTLLTLLSVRAHFISGSVLISSPFSTVIKKLHGQRQNALPKNKKEEKKSKEKEKIKRHTEHRRQPKCNHSLNELLSFIGLWNCICRKCIKAQDFVETKKQIVSHEKFLFSHNNWTSNLAGNVAELVPGGKTAVSGVKRQRREA